MSNFLLPKIGCNLSSARISRLFFGFWRSCFLMCAQIFFVTSLRGSGSVPTILARCSEGCIGFIKPLFFALGAVFAIFLSVHWRKRDQLRHHRNCNRIRFADAKRGKFDVVAVRRSRDASLVDSPNCRNEPKKHRGGISLIVLSRSKYNRSEGRR